MKKVLFLLLSFAGIIPISVIAQQSKNYYLSAEGSDSNDGTEASPWLSLDKISATALQPGDSVFFRKGDRFDGHYIMNGSGTKENPIVITAYGEGDRPIITGEVGESGGGDYREAILVQNEDNLVFDGLEIQNDRLVSRSGVDDTDAFGIWVTATNGIYENYVFQNMSFKDVYAVEPILDRESFDAIQVSGLRVTSNRNTSNNQIKQIKNVEVKDSFFGNLQRFGIQFRASRGNEGIGNDSLNRIMNVHVHDNEFSYNGGTGVLPNGTYNCLIENNLFDHPGSDNDPRMPARGSSIWNIHSINTVMQHNVCLSTRGYLDSYGIHIDKNNVNTFVQYNYMDDCEGGFVEILAGNKNAVYRYNVSLNSGFRQAEWASSNCTIYIYSDRFASGGLDLSDSVFVYNNTVVIDSAFNTTFNVDAKNMFIYNNIFSSTNGSGMGQRLTVIRNNETPFRLTNNLYEGNVSQDWMDADLSPIEGAPRFVDGGQQEEAFLLGERSAALKAGAIIQGPILPGAGEGIFKDLPPYPTTDFYGNPIDFNSGVNIGAYNGAGVVDENGPLNAESDLNSWNIYPNPTDGKIFVSAPSSATGISKVTVLDMQGKIVHFALFDLMKGKRFEFQMSGKKTGLYLMKVENHGMISKRRFILH
ncbi:MAG: T9SS type A sorting domain-containing protein [Bacteroidota bacterium]